MIREGLNFLLLCNVSAVQFLELGPYPDLGIEAARSPRPARVRVRHSIDMSKVAGARREGGREREISFPLALGSSSNHFH